MIWPISSGSEPRTLTTRYIVSWIVLLVCKFSQKPLLGLCWGYYENRQGKGYVLLDFNMNQVGSSFRWVSPFPVVLQRVFSWTSRFSRFFGELDGFGFKHGRCSPGKLFPRKMGRAHVINRGPNLPGSQRDRGLYGWPCQVHLFCVPFEVVWRGNHRLGLLDSRPNPGDRVGGAVPGRKGKSPCLMSIAPLPGVLIETFSGKGDLAHQNHPSPDGIGMWEAFPQGLP